MATMSRTGALQLLLTVVLLMLSPCSALLHLANLEAGTGVNLSASAMVAARSVWARRARSFALSQPRIAALQLRNSSSGHVARAMPRLLHVTAKDCKNPAFADKIARNFKSAADAGFEVRCYGAQEQEDYIKANVPERLQLFKRLPALVMKADLFRYFLLAREGGFYADADVTTFPALAAGLARLDAAGADRALGWERRTPGVALGTWCNDFGGMLCNSLAMYAFGVRANDPLMQDVADNIAQFLESKAFDHGFPSNSEVLRSTGPVAFTTRLLMHVDPTSVMDIRAFGCGQAHSESPRCSASDPAIFVQHHFEGSWRH